MTMNGGRGCMATAHSHRLRCHARMASEQKLPGDDRRVIDLSAFDAAVFDLDGVITRTASVHASAWKRLFDDFLQSRTAQTGEPFLPFDLEHDYRQYVDGKPRYDGVRSFLQSRGIVLPEGQPDDPPERETVSGLGNRKNIMFNEMLGTMGVEVFDTSVRLVHALRAAELKTAVVSSSRNTRPVLAAAQLGDLFDVCVDGIEAARLGLQGKPAPDTFAHAIRELRVAPSRALGFEDALAGVEAIRAAGYGLVVGVDRTGHAHELAEHGADVVVQDVGELILRGHKASNVAEQQAAVPPGPAVAVGFPVAPTPDPDWLLIEEGFTLTREHEIESIFAISNGYIGTRGSLAEGSALSAPATFVAGVYDAEPGASLGLATVPDWTRLAVTVEGQPLRLDAGRHLANRRILDMRQAILWREWRHEDAVGRVSNIGGLRLTSAADRHLLVQSVTFSPENYSGVVSVDTPIGGLLSKQTATGVTIALATATCLSDSTGRAAPLTELARTQSIPVQMGTSYRLDRVVAVHTSRDGPHPEAMAREHADRAIQSYLKTLVGEHCRAWAERWAACDVRIEGDPAAQRALRFAIYHLLGAVNPQDEAVSIGARALTGGAYKGHVFWDTETYMLPFFTLTFPEAARALLMYRHRTLPAARRRAQHAGYRGAWYAWESADTGDDVTPAMIVQPDGDIVRVLTGEQEQHISADIAHAVWNYWLATADEGFLLEAGAEIVLETARFWASRVEHDDNGSGHIRGVIGPDEYHETVDDNAYTNGMAGWNLRAGARVARLMAQRWPGHWDRLAATLELSEEETAQWTAIADSLHTGFDEKTGLIEQFRGYFALEDIPLSSLEPRTAPVDVLIGRERLQGSQIIKQADVVLLLYLLWDDYPPEVREANFRYYEPRCAHGSSLSPAIHSLVAARLDDVELAVRYFHQAMDIDLANNMGNAAGGVHAAALGGLWQAAVHGFGGLYITEHGPEIRPHLPPQWRALSMRYQWRSQVRDLAVTAPSAADTVQGEHP